MAFPLHMNVKDREPCCNVYTSMHTEINNILRRVAAGEITPVRAKDLLLF